jgi:hypothetical protein
LTARELFVDRHGALLPPWRLLVFLAAIALCAVVAQIVIAGPLAATGALAGWRMELFAVATLLVLLAAHWLTFRWTRTGSWASIGLGAAAARPRLLVAGALLGALAIGVPTLLLLGIGWLAPRPAPPGSSLLAALRFLLLFAPAALFEELLVRGYAFATLRDWLGAPAALLITSLVFGLLHWSNPGANLQSVAQVVLAGVWLGGVLLATGSLWAAWMAHLAWNWTMAALFHAPVSGLAVGTPDFRLVDAGPDWATGGAWGPEGGLGATLGMVASLVFLFARRARRGEIQA